MEVCENKKKYRLREATAEDMMLYVEWVNDPVVRQNSFQTGTIDLATHEAWFAGKLEDAACLMYVLTDGITDFGQVRGQICAGRIEISYSIAKEHRGKGLARIMLALFAKECTALFPGNEMDQDVFPPNRVKKEKPMKPADRLILYAEVKKENPTSGKVFEGLGYGKTETEDIFVYTKEL